MIALKFCNAKSVNREAVGWQIGPECVFRNTSGKIVSVQLNKIQKCKKIQNTKIRQSVCTGTPRAKLCPCRQSAAQQNTKIRKKQKYGKVCLEQEDRRQKCVRVQGEEHSAGTQVA